MEKTCEGGLPTKTQDPHLTLRHGYTPVNANPVFLNRGICEPQYPVELQQVSVNNVLNFDQHISRVLANCTEDRKISLMLSFIHANCNYCP